MFIPIKFFEVICVPGIQDLHKKEEKVLEIGLLQYPQVGNHLVY